MKIYTTLAIAAIALVACAKQPLVNNGTHEMESIDKNDSYFNVDVEQTAGTKATLNASYQTLWKTGDDFGVLVYKGDWNTLAPCRLTSGNGETQGVFTGPLYNYESKLAYDNTNSWNVAAVFPYDYSNPQQMITKDGDVTFTLPAEYENYTTGRSFLPLLADLSSSGEDRPSKASFFHVGGGVKITVNSVPAIANAMRMKVDGQKITGSFASVKNKKAGAAESPATLSASASSSNDQSVKLTFGKDNAGNYDFVFPVPAIENPTLIFNLIDEHDLILWSAKASNQSDIGRAQIMVFEETLTVDESKIAANVLKKNDFYLVGYDVDIDAAGAYDDTGYEFSGTGALSTYSAPRDAWACVKDGNGKYYSISSSIFSLTTYVDINNTDLTSKSEIGIILNNKEKGNDAGSQTGDKTLTLDGSSDYIIHVADGTFENVTNGYLGYSNFNFPVHSGKTRIYVIDDSGYSGTHKLYLYYGSSKLADEWDWPGKEFSNSGSVYARTTTISYQGTSMPYNKIYLPSGATPLISYNSSDGTITFEY